MFRGAWQTCKELDTIEQLTHTHTHIYSQFILIILPRHLNRKSKYFQQTALEQLNKHI